MVYDPVPLFNIRFKHSESKDNLSRMAPGAALDRLGDASFINHTVAGIIKSVLKGEEAFERPFGGYAPNNSQFGATLLGAIPISLVMNLVSDGRAILLIIAYYDMDRGRKIRRIQLSSNNKTFPIWDALHMELLSTDLIRLPEPIIIDPGSTFEYRLWDQDGNEVSITKDAGFIGYVFASYGYLLGESLRKV